MGRVKIEEVKAVAYEFPTDEPESDGTLRWGSTTMAAVFVQAGGKRGFGYSYADAAAASLVRDKLSDILIGTDAFNIPYCRAAMRTEIRNLGESGIAFMALSAVDIALWDLKAKLLDVPLADLLGRARTRVKIYGSGGFTSYDKNEIKSQLGGWVSEGISGVKMKIGRDPKKDPDRVRWAREAIGPDTALFVDANGAFDRKRSLAMAEVLNEYGVTWYEEPVPQADTEGLRFVRERVPPSIEVASGEYGFVPDDFRVLLQSGSVDVLMADATRCGITGYIQAAALCEAHHIPLSAHCAPAVHLHPSCALEPVRHIEYFHDHVRIENMIFDGAPRQKGGFLTPDLGRPGLGLEFKEADAAKYIVNK